MSTKPVLNDIGNDPITNNEITKEPLNENFQLVNDYAEDIEKFMDEHGTNDLEIAYLAVKGKRELDKSKKSTQEKEAEIAKEVAANAAGGSSEGNKSLHKGDLGNIIDLSVKKPNSMF